MDKNDFWEGGAPFCPSCSRKMHGSSASLAGRAVRSWKYANCGEEIVHPVDAQLALSLNKLKCGVKLKVGELNKAPYVRFTKDFSSVLRKGAHAIATLLSPTEIIVNDKNF